MVSIAYAVRIFGTIQFFRIVGCYVDYVNIFMFGDFVVCRSGTFNHPFVRQAQIAKGRFDFFHIVGPFLNCFFLFYLAFKKEEKMGVIHLIVTVLMSVFLYFLYADSSIRCHSDACLSFS